MKSRFALSDPGDTDFFWELRRFDALDYVFHSPGASAAKPDVLTFFFRASIKHRGVIDKAIDFSLHAGLRGPESSPSLFPADPFCVHPKFIPGAIGASNILNPTQHYMETFFGGEVGIVVPGYYRLEIWGKSRSDAAPGVDGLAELVKEDNPLNRLWGWIES